LLNFNLQQVAAKKRSTDKTDRLARKATWEKMLTI
jgi:hypothetical protein